MAEQHQLYGLPTLNTEENKQCDVCWAYMPYEKFDKDHTTWDGYDHRCKKCKSSERLLRHYGLTMGDYARMRREQENRCAICERDDKDLVIDHDHVTQKVRGLLCTLCNTGLGNFGDNVRGLQRAVNYLKKALE